MNNIYQITFQLDAFQNDAFQTYYYPVSAATGLLQIDGSTLILESYFKNTDLYLGLWSGSTPTVSASLSGFSGEIGYFDYERILIPKNDFVFNAEERIVYTNRKYSFSPRTQNWTIDGYFICSSLDNSGVFIDVVKFKKPEILEQYKYLNIQPSLSIFGGIAAVRNFETISFDFLADGTWYAGLPSKISAIGSISYTLTL